MPEGDVVHRSARRLQLLVGERVEATSPHPRGLATGAAAAVDGRVLESVRAVGKHLLLRFEGGVVLRSHLRMRGRWRVTPRDAPVLGLPWLWLRGGEWQATQWNGPILALDTSPLARLGPDLLSEETAVDDVVRRLRREDPRRLVGEALLDQGVVAGIGNMWAAESLWRERVSPWAALEDLGDEELGRVLVWAKEAMRTAIDGPRPPRAAHRRAGRPCPRCGTAIVSRGLGEANRTAYWCPRCQGSGGGGI
ncbi:MAG: DNA-formamidopyrimidine glycosylase family protein [Thermoleophilia bacterium]|nr:DNA-formamidopyrimidine glycosylase family protein [Thermoleophilia bacterium]